MKIAILGTGMVGTALAGALSALGHSVVIGTRDVSATLAKTEGPYGAPPFSEWLAQHSDVRLLPLDEAAAYGELIVNATNGSASVAVLEAAGTDNIGDKVLVDVANPLDFSNGFPPGLFVKDTDSLAEQIQRTFPRAKVVKSLNTLNAVLTVNPKQLADGDHSVFVAGNDADAKATVVALLHELGHTDVLDLGDLTGARGTEMLLPIWLRLANVLGTYKFQFKIVR